MDWYLAVLNKYAVFSGRSRRKEYWMFFLINFLITLVLGFVETLLGTSGVIGFLYGLAIFIPNLAVAVRRLHDTDRSGWWLLIGLIPLIGVIVLLVFFIQDGTGGENEFGPDPKLAMADV